MWKVIGRNEWIGVGVENERGGGGAEGVGSGRNGRWDMSWWAEFRRSVLIVSH